MKIEIIKEFVESVSYRTELQMKVENQVLLLATKYNNVRNEFKNENEYKELISDLTKEIVRKALIENVNAIYLNDFVVINQNEDIISIKTNLGVQSISY